MFLKFFMVFCDNGGNSEREETSKLGEERSSDKEVGMKSDGDNLDAETFCVGMKSGEPEMFGEEFETFGVASEAFAGFSVAAFGM